MRANTFLFGVLLLTFSGIEGQEIVPFRVIDRNASNVRVSSPQQLAVDLTKSYTTDIEKVRSIFSWIAQNIDYRTRYSVNRKSISIISDDDQPGPPKSLDERVAEQVLQRGFAICDGYSRLFNVLCYYAGLESHVITGYGKSSSHLKRFGTNHTWNAVRVDGAWQLVDVTWASGYISNEGDYFIRQFDESYFCPKPEKFIREHFPDDVSWTLLDKAPVVQEFNYSPFRQRTFSKYRINKYWPARGIIEARVGDTIRIVLETADVEYDKHIGGDPFLDFGLFNKPFSIVLEPIASYRAQSEYKYVVNSPSVEWIYIRYNDDLILRYRLQLK